MNFNAVKERFLEYINANADNDLVRGNFELRTQLIRKGSVENISIFSNMELFQQFLEKEYDYDIKDKSASLSIDDIVKNMEIVDNQLVELGEENEAPKEVEEGEQIEESEDISQEETNDTSKIKKDNKDDENLDDTELIKGIINELLQDKDFISSYDKSGDDAIDMKELTKYLKEISKADDNGKDISIQDLIEGKTKKEKEKEKEKSPVEEFFDKAGETFDNVKDNVKETVGNVVDGVKNAASNIKNAFTGGYSSGGYGGGYSSSVAPVVSKYNKDGSLNLDNLNLSELQQAKTEEQSKYNEKQQSLNTLYSDGGELEGAKQNVDKMLESYNQKLEETDKDLAQQIKAKETEIATKESEISAKEAQITSQEAAISQAESNVSNIESSIESLNNAKSTITTTMGNLEGEKKAGAQAKLNNINNEIANKQKALEDAKAKVEEEKRKLDELKTGEGGLNTLKEELTQLNSNEEGQLGYLQNQMAEKHPDVAPQLESMYQNYKDAKDVYETQTKPQAIESAKAEMTKSQEQINKINTKIEECKTSDTVQENAVYNSSLPQNVAQALDNKLGSGFSDKLQQICERINCNPEDLVGLMYSESGINPAAVNKSSGATGLIQFMRTTAKSLGTSTEALKNMNGIQQLDYVEKYLQNWKNNLGFSNDKELSAGDLYTLVFLPGLCKNETLTYRGDPKGYYKSNSGLDLDKDGKITKTDLSNQVKRKYQSFLKNI